MCCTTSNKSLVVSFWQRHSALLSSPLGDGINSLVVVPAVLMCACLRWQDPYPERSMKALDVVDTQGRWLLNFASQKQAPVPELLLPSIHALPESAESTSGGGNGSSSAAAVGEKADRQLIAEQWMAVLRALARASTVPNQHLRNRAIQALHGCVPSICNSVLITSLNSGSMLYL